MKEMKIVNLTPHAIRLYKPDGSVVEIPPSGRVARVATRRVERGSLSGGIPVVSIEYGEVEGLPDPQEGTIYVVSSIVLQAVKGRGDVFAPDTSPEGAVRDEKGNVVGVRALVASPSSFSWSSKNWTWLRKEADGCPRCGRPLKDREWKIVEGVCPNCLADLPLERIWRPGWKSVWSFYLKCKKCGYSPPPSGGGAMTVFECPHCGYRGVAGEVDWSDKDWISYSESNRPFWFTSRPPSVPIYTVVVDKSPREREAEERRIRELLEIWEQLPDDVKLSIYQKAFPCPYSPDCGECRRGKVWSSFLQEHVPLHEASRKWEAVEVALKEGWIRPDSREPPRGGAGAAGSSPAGESPGIR